MKKHRQLLNASAIVLILFATSSIAPAQTTAFNFQGRLNDGSSPANGRYDLQFLLYDALVGGNQIGSIVQKPNLQLINGVFSTQLDFGAAAFTGGDRFLEIQLRPTASQNATPNAFVILGARQQLLSVPYSVRSLNATNANNAQTAVNATNSANSSSLGGVAANNYLLKTGDGSQLTNVTAVNSQQLGGVAASQYIQKDANGNIALSGNLTQPLANNGLPKAIVHLDRDGNITYCYNAVTGTSTGNCGFSTSHSIGLYYVNFGFKPNSVIATSEFDADSTGVTVQYLNNPNTRVLFYVTYIGRGYEGTPGVATNAPINIVAF